MHVFHKSLIAVALVGAVVYLGYVRNHAIALEGTRQVRLLLSHRPTSVYSDAQKVFADTLKKESDGRLSLTVLMPEDVGFTGVGDIPYHQTLAYLDQGATDLSSVYTVAAATDVPGVGAVTVPYAFSDYQAASNVFEGPVGAGILRAYSAGSAVRAMAFTYSGGFRILASKTKNIESLDDLRGLRVATSGGPAAEAFLTAVGAVPVSLNLESGSAVLDDVDAVETTYARLSEVVGTGSPFLAHITETNHSLFTTIFVASGRFFDSLSPDDQRAIQVAASAAARAERQDAIALNDSTKAALIRLGSTVTVPSDALQTALKKEAQALSSQFSSLFGSSASTVQRAGWR